MEVRRRFILPSWVIPTFVLLALGWIPMKAALDGLSGNNDNVLHLLRVAQLDHLWSQGVLFSRMAPDMGLGYGLPVFNFYPPLSHYLALILGHLAGSLTRGFQAVAGLTIVLRGLGTYFLARDIFPEEAALLGGVAAMYAPYQAYNALFRGAVPEAMGWALLPWALWAVGRAVRTAKGGWLATGAILIGLLLFNHHLTAIVGVVVLALCGLMEVLAPSPLSRSRRLGSFLLLMSLGLGVSAFSWLPAWVERPLVQLERIVYGFPGGYAAHFLPRREALMAIEPVQPDWINPTPPRTLGLVPVLVGFPALLGLRRFSSVQRQKVAFFAIMLVGALFLTTSSSQSIWSAFPLLHTFQFPWRFLGLASLGLSVLIAATVSLFGPLRRQWAIGLPMAVGLILADLFWLHPRYVPGWEQVSIGSLHTFEYEMRGARTAADEFLPRWVRLLPSEPPKAIFDPFALPEGTTIREEVRSPLSAEAWVESPEPFQVTVNRFYYPGWRAWVDGQEVGIAPETEWGRFTFSVPAGRHRIAVRFGETPLRLAADILSVLSLLALVLVAVFTSTPIPPPPSTGEGAGGWGLWMLPLLATATVLLVERFQLPPVYQRRLTEEGIRGVSIPAHIVYDNQFHLLGWDSIPPIIPADQPVPLQLYWRDTVPGGPDYRIQPDLIGDVGETWNAFPVPMPAYYPPPSSRTWPVGGYATTGYHIYPLLGTPPGVYTVMLTVFDSETLLPYTAYQDGQALGPEIVLGQVLLTRPSAPPSLAALGVPEIGPMPSWEPIRLLRGSVREQGGRPGDPLHLELYWEALETPDEDYRMKVWVDGPGGREWERPLTRADFPTLQWQEGDRWLGLHKLRLPPGVESGEHGLWLQLCRREGDECRMLGEPALLERMRIEAPARSWAVPPLRVKVNALLGGEVTLVGAVWGPGGEVLRPGSALTVTLVWRGEREMEESYRVFLHLLGPDGSLVAQSDGEPAGWTRPTTGWLPGEVVVDERVLVLPPDLSPGEYRLMAGMYQYGGPRLTTPEGADTVLLAVLWGED